MIHHFLSNNKKTAHKILNHFILVFREQNTRTIRTHVKRKFINDLNRSKIIVFYVEIVQRSINEDRFRYGIIIIIYVIAQVK